MQENGENKKGMNKKQNLLYFKWKGKALDPDNAEADHLENWINSDWLKNEKIL